MRWLVLLMVAAVVFGSVASAERWEREDRGGEGEELGNMERGFAIQEMEMELETRRSERQFEREMRELELDERRAEIERASERENWGHKGHDKGGKIVFWLICLVVHILVAIWIYGDLRQRNVSGGVWIVIGLLTGLLGALVYAIVRLGDIRKVQAQG
jgi:hypothetical protein